MGGGAPAVCCRTEGGKGDTTFLLSTPVAVYRHAGLFSRGAGSNKGASVVVWKGSTGSV